jgi:hypothetical protein
MATQHEVDIEGGVEDLQEKIHLITIYQRPYIANSLKNMAQVTFNGFGKS